MSAQTVRSVRWTPYVAQDKGFFQQYSVQTKIVDFNDPTTLMESLASGQLDVALVGIAPSAIWQERGVRLKVVAAANGGGHVLLTRDDTDIRTLADLRGRKVATPKPGTVTDTLFRAHILGDLAHLDAERDIQQVPNMAAADMSTVLFVSREVDAAIAWEPFASQAETNSKTTSFCSTPPAEWRKVHPDLPYPLSRERRDCEPGVHRCTSGGAPALLVRLCRRGSIHQPAA